MNGSKSSGILEARANFMKTRLERICPVFKHRGGILNLLLKIKQAKNLRYYFAVSPASSTLHFVHWPMVLGLSLSSSFLYFFILLPAFIKLYRTHNLLHTICNQHTLICQRILEAMNQNGQAGASNEWVGFVFGLQVRALNDDSFSGEEIKVYGCAIVFALFAVTAFELYA